MSTQVEIDSPRNCDICTHGKAWADGKTVMGPWANMCRTCFNFYGVGLGTGKGQRLIVREGQSNV